MDTGNEDAEDPRRGDPCDVDELAEEMYQADVEDMEDGDIGDEDIEEAQYDTSQFTFSKHDGSVFVVDVDSSGKFVVSGGEDDRAYIWLLESGEVYHEFRCQDSVTCAQFNCNSTLVAIGDMSGVIKVLDLSTKEEVWSFETSDLEWMEWHPKASVLMAGTTGGDAWLWKVPSGESKTFPSPGSVCNCGKILSDGKTAALGFADGSIRLFDLKTQQLLHTIKTGGHRAPVNHITSTNDGQIIISGSLDGITLLSSVATGKINAIYRQGQRTNNETTRRSIEYLGYSERLCLVAAASLDDHLYLWDIKTGNLRCKCAHPDGVTRLCWDSQGLNVFTGCLDGICRQWDARTGQLAATYVGHSDEIYDLVLSRDDKFLITASSDNTARIFEVENDSSQSN